MSDKKPVELPKEQIHLKGELHLEIVHKDGTTEEIVLPNTLTDNMRRAVASLITAGLLGRPTQITLGTGAHSSIMNDDINASNDAPLGGTNDVTFSRFGQVFGNFTGGPSTYQVGTAVMWLKRQGAPAGNVYAEIVTVSPNTNAGTPTTTVVATSEPISIAALPTAANWVPFTFSTPPTLTATSYYALVLRSVGYTPSAGISSVIWMYDNSPIYANGAGKRYSGSWGNFGTTDFIFMIITKPTPDYTDVYGTIFSKGLTSATTPGETTARLLTNFATTEGNDFIGHVGLKDADGRLLAIRDTAYLKTNAVSINAYWVIGVG